jgi:hypothetical protein
LLEMHDRNVSMPFAIRSTPPAPGVARGALAAGALALLLGACSTPDVGFGESTWSPLTAASMPFSGSASTVTSESVTIQRLRGVEPEVTPLTVEAGNVWPDRETQRATLMSGPDEAMRNIPEYRPSLVQGAPAARSPFATPGVPGSGTPGGLGTTSGLPPAPTRVTPALPPSPPGGVGIRPEGQVRIDPSGRPAVTTGTAGNVSGFTQPGGGGAVIRDGNVETFIGPDGRARTRVVTP